jgi:hypothetical protein
MLFQTVSAERRSNGDDAAIAALGILLPERAVPGLREKGSWEHPPAWMDRSEDAANTEPALSDVQERVFGTKGNAVV